jgi:NADP-dependent 3-hydroxy acid dehydrogenase YdfG
MASRPSRLYSPLDIAGQVALVTGASSGIGLATAERLAEAGCALVLVARREDRLQALAQRLQAEYSVRGGPAGSVVRKGAAPDPVSPQQLLPLQVRVHVVAQDMQDIAGVVALPQRLPEGFREVGILINNAGLALGTTSVAEHDIQVRQPLDT